MFNTKMDTLISLLEEDEINCVVLTEQSDWIKNSSEDNVTYKDACEIYGKEKRASVYLYALHYSDEKKNHITQELVDCRYNCIQNIYYRWCKVVGRTPNEDEGWFKSKSFDDYLDYIGYYGSNYVVMLAN